MYFFFFPNWEKSKHLESSCKFLFHAVLLQTAILAIGGRDSFRHRGPVRLPGGKDPFPPDKSHDVLTRPIKPRKPLCKTSREGSDDLRRKVDCTAAMETGFSIQSHYKTVAVK